MMKGKRNRQGQSTVEYVIVFTAIAAAIIFAAVNIIKPAVNNTYVQAGESIDRGATFFGNRIGGGIGD
ncbi:MAG: hypothetical protein PHY46_05770 [Candidatus Omnitrophica bacterium]|nr:hypothetical protein [Candidatus Omnitrophota bacterium]MDD5355297.1 hypothetical protein [Candidatus Omnitrophota bacterium]